MSSHTLKSSIVDTFEFREVLGHILSRDLKIKYKRTFFGYFWSLLNPLLQLAVLTVVFSHAMKLGMKDYTLYLFSGLIAWMFFSTALTTGAGSLLENEHFIKKIYMPKLLFPLSRVILRLIDFGFALVALLALGAVAGFPLHPTLLLVPVAVFSLCLFTLGGSLLLGVMTVYLRDVEYLLGVFLQLLYFATPILYPLDVMPERFRFYAQLNPLYSQLLLFHKLIYYGSIPGPAEWGVALGSSLLIFLFGLFILTRFEDDMVYRM